MAVTGLRTQCCNKVWDILPLGTRVMSVAWWTRNEQGLSTPMGDLGTGKSEKGEETGTGEMGFLTGDGNSVCKGDVEQETGKLLRRRVEKAGSKS